MKFGIYYAYWATEWGGEFIPYVEKVKGLGFDILEVACGNFDQNDLSQCRELRRAAEDNGILLTGGYGPRPEHNLASTDEAAVEKAFGFYGDVFRKMEAAGIQSLCGALYSYCLLTLQAISISPAILTEAPGECSGLRIWLLIMGLRSTWRRSIALKAI